MVPTVLKMYCVYVFLSSYKNVVTQFKCIVDYILSRYNCNKWYRNYPGLDT